jgi:hypothetical protein
MSEFDQNLSPSRWIANTRGVRAQRSCDIMLHFTKALKIWDVENQTSSSRALCPRRNPSQFCYVLILSWLSPSSSNGSNPVNSSVPSSRN